MIVFEQNSIYAGATCAIAVGLVVGKFDVTEKPTKYSHVAGPPKCFQKTFSTNHLHHFFSQQSFVNQLTANFSFTDDYVDSRRRLRMREC